MSVNGVMTSRTKMLRCSVLLQHIRSSLWCGSLLRSMYPWRRERFGIGPPIQRVPIFGMVLSRHRARRVVVRSSLSAVSILRTICLRRTMSIWWGPIIGTFSLTGSVCLRRFVRVGSASRLWAFSASRSERLRGAVFIRGVPRLRTLSTRNSMRLRRRESLRRLPLWLSIWPRRVPARGSSSIWT